MCKVFEGSFGDPEFRGGADFIPFTVDELKDITAFEAQIETSWTPPLTKLTFFELCEQLRTSAEVSTMPSDENVEPMKVVSVGTSTIESVTPVEMATVETITPQDSNPSPPSGT